MLRSLLAHVRPKVAVPLCRKIVSTTSTRLRPTASVKDSGAVARLCTAAAPVEEQYARPLQWMHWIYAGGFVTCLGTVAASQQTTGPTFLGTKGETKGTLMMIHKSTAVILAALVWPRILLRGLSAVPKQLPGSFPEHFAANISHVSLYGFMIAMPATGMAMGYYGGKGIPFYGLFTIPGKSEGRTKEDGKFAGQMFKWHKVNMARYSAF